MAYATGPRVLGALCYILGGVTIIGIPFFWPLGWALKKKAEEIEAERDAELNSVTG